MRSTSTLLLAATTATAVHALPELSISKRDAQLQRSAVAKGVLKRDSNSGGTVETNVYDVLTWSTGGAYYANGKCFCALSRSWSWDWDTNTGRES
jgi:hypothetical protein